MENDISVEGKRRTVLKSALGGAFAGMAGITLPDRVLAESDEDNCVQVDLIELTDGGGIKETIDSNNKYNDEDRLISWLWGDVETEDTGEDMDNYPYESLETDCVVTQADDISIDFDSGEASVTVSVDDCGEETIDLALVSYEAPCGSGTEPGWEGSAQSIFDSTEESEIDNSVDLTVDIPEDEEAEAVKNATTGETYGTIQDALDAAESGHELEAEAGTFDESPTIDDGGDDRLTLSGEGSGEDPDENTVIDGSFTIEDGEDRNILEDLRITGDLTVNSNYNTFDNVTVEGEYNDNGEGNDFVNSPESVGGPANLNGSDGSVDEVTVNGDIDINGNGYSIENTNVGSRVRIGDAEGTSLTNVEASEYDFDTDPESAENVAVIVEGGESITDAITNAGENDGVDTVRVKDGTYEESVTVDVEGLTLEAAGESDSTIAPDENVDAVRIGAEEVIIDGFVIEVEGDAVGVDLVLDSLEGEQVFTLTDNVIDLTAGSADAIGIDASGPADFDEDISGNDFLADGEAETYVTDPTDALDLDVIEENNEFDPTVVLTSGDSDYALTSTISEGISVADSIADANTVTAFEGTYEESVSIDVDGLTLEGPNAGIHGDSEDRGDEAVITEGISWDDQDYVTVDGFEIEDEVADGNGVFQLGQGTGVIGNNAIIKNNIVNADPQADTRMAGILWEGDSDDALFVESNLITQEASDDEDPTMGAVDAFTHNESDIGLWEVTNNTLATEGSGFVAGSGDSSEINAVVAGNEFTDVSEAFPGVDINDGDSIEVDIEENTFDDAIAGVRVNEGIDVANGDSVDISDNDFIGDETTWYVEDNSETLDLEAILNDQGNTFDPDGEIDDNQIVPQE